MKRIILAAFSLILLCSAGIRAQQEQDIEGSKDHPLMSRMTGYYIDLYEPKDFDSYESPYAEGKDARWEGAFTKVDYTVKTGAKQASPLQISRNYLNAVKALGGKILFNDGRVMEGKVEKNGGFTYLHVEAFNDGRNYEVVTVETRPMKQEVAADASALGASIAATGKAAVYGIYFDTGRSNVKPESNPTLDEITKLMKQSPTLTLWVVGHTDNAGGLDNNLKLSADRAESVVKALAGRGIAAARMKSAGVGPYCPVASNRTEPGKAKNRRVELVDQK